MCDINPISSGVCKMRFHDQLKLKLKSHKLNPFLNTNFFNLSYFRSGANTPTGSNCNLNNGNNNSMKESSETLLNDNDRKSKNTNNTKNTSSSNNGLKKLKNAYSVPDFTTLDEEEYLNIRSLRKESLSTSSLETLTLENDSKGFIARFTEKVSDALMNFELKIKNFDCGICNDLTIDMNTMVRVLKEDNLNGIAQYIKENGCKNIIVMSGAGISTNAEIPDFRSADRGVYANLEKYNIPYPEAIFDLEYFKINPKPFTIFAREIYPQNIRPTIAHCFIKLLDNHKILLRHYTQNIDGLDYQTRLDSDRIIESHGSFHQSYCVGSSKSESCGSIYPQSWYKEKLFKGENPILCPKCQKGYVKPGVIFFNENLPPKFFKSLHDDIPKCDLLLILGTSLKVYPFASIVKSVSKKIPRCLINNTLPEIFEAELSCDASNAEYIFSGNQYQRDVTYIGDCDKGCLELAKALGWDEELMEIYENEVEYANKYFN